MLLRCATTATTDTQRVRSRSASPACLLRNIRSLDALTRLRGRRSVVMLTTMGASYETINVIIVVVVALVYSYRLVNNNNDDETNNLSIG